MAKERRQKLLQAKQKEDQEAEVILEPKTKAGAKKT